MKALFVGDYNYLTVAFAAKLAKNGVDLAISNQNKVKQEFTFKYTKYDPEHAYITNLYQNFRPDVIIFTAAFDEQGNDLDLLQNVLLEAKENKIDRLIFLSSSTIYGIDSENRMPGETAPLNPRSKRALSFAVGEDICRRWAAVSDTKVTILRISGLYGPDTHFAHLNRLLRDLLSGEDVTLQKESMISFLHIDDATEAFMQIFDTGFSELYNISTARILDAEAFKTLIHAHLPDAGGEIRLDASAQTECLTADNARLRQEYQWHERHRLEEALDEVIQGEKDYIAKKQRDAQKQEKKRRWKENPSLLKEVLGYLETLLLFVLLFYVTGIKPAGDLLAGIDFTVIYLVIIAVMMNLHQSAFSLLLSVWLLIYQKVLAGYDVFSAVISNHTLLLAAEYCIVSIAVSYVLQRMRTQNRLLRMDMQEQERDIRQLEQFSEDNLRTRHFFEDQILEYELSLPRIISMASRLDSLEPDRILPETIKIISESLNVPDVAAYYIGKRGGRMRLSYARTKDAGKLGQSPLIEQLSEMMEPLLADEVFVNRALCKNLPDIASGVKIGGHLTFVVTIWDVPFSKMGQDVSNLLKSITILVSAALRRANQYEELTVQRRYLPGTMVIRPKAFRTLCKTRLSEEGVGGVLCRIEGEKDQVAAFAKQLEGFIRENDYLGIDENARLYVLLTGTTEAGYRVFAKRLLEKGMSSVPVDGGEL